ncbi:unnamed protein product [Amoebophrya sp. A120]|nr:unnamed protein product [Amoebophrya sp. A120]|eukprot:GSA120T00017164001.1
MLALFCVSRFFGTLLTKNHDDHAADFAYAGAATAMSDLPYYCYASISTPIELHLHSQGRPPLLQRVPILLQSGIFGNAYEGNSPTVRRAAATSNVQHFHQSASHKVEGGSSGYESSGEAAKTSTSSAKKTLLESNAELNNADCLEALYSQQLYCLASAPFGVKTLPRRCQGRRGRLLSLSEAGTSSTADSQPPPAGGLRRVEACSYLGSLGIPSSQEPSEQRAPCIFFSEAAEPAPSPLDSGSGSRTGAGCVNSIPPMRTYQGQGAAGDGDSDSEPGFLARALGLRSGFSRATSCGSDSGAAEPPSNSCHTTACSGV